MIVSICMPAFNESFSLSSYLDEIVQCFQDQNVCFFVVDDKSTDDSIQILKKLERKYELSGLAQINVIRNSTNLGHGPTLLRALNLASKHQSEIIFAIDSDGVVAASELFLAFTNFKKYNLEMMELVRKDRHEPWFRRITTRLLRILVLLRTGKIPKDANTPFRIYRREFLDSILFQLGDSQIVPNLKISILARLRPIRMLEFSVHTRPRLGLSNLGTTWNQKKFNIPSKTFIIFCWKAFCSII